MHANPKKDCTPLISVVPVVTHTNHGTQTTNCPSLESVLFAADRTLGSMGMIEQCSRVQVSIFETNIRERRVWGQEMAHCAVGEVVVPLMLMLLLLWILFTVDRLFSLTMHSPDQIKVPATMVPWTAIFFSDDASLVLLANNP